MADASGPKGASTSRPRHVADDIVAKAGDLFDSQGYAETSLQDVADAVGIARPSLYHYFASKEEILVTIVERTIVVRDDIIERVSAAGDSDARARLATLLTDLGRSMSRNPTGLRLLLAAGGVLPPALRRRDLRSRRAMFELLSELLADGMRQGAFRPADARATAAAVIAALTGLQYRDIGGVSTAPDEAATLLVDLLLDGLCTGGGRGPANVDDAVASIHDSVRFLEWHARSSSSDGAS